MLKGKKIILSEGRETKNMAVAKHYLYDKLGYNEQQAMELIGKIKTDIPNVRLGKCKFILGAVRLFCERQLADGATILNFNKTLKYIASDAHIEEYDQNLNGMSAGDIINRFKTVASNDVEKSRKELSAVQYQKNRNYTIKRITSFEEAQQYGEYTSWCVTHSANMFDSYTSGGLGLFYFILRNGFEKEQEIVGENTPLDSYGLSMIAVSINPDGSLNTCTCRWNHNNGGNDSVMNEKEISNLIGRNFYDVFLPYSKEEVNKKIIDIIEGNTEGDLKNVAQGHFEIPENVTEIGRGAFYGCTSLTSIVIPEGVTEIGASAFEDCKTITSITIPEGVTKIGAGAFAYCESLTSITIPESVTDVGEWAFEYCESLTSIIIPKSVTVIERSTFYNCKSLTSITIPEIVTEIEGWAFEGCKSLISITIPASVTEIGTGVFSNCPNLTVYVPDERVAALVKKSYFEGSIKLLPVQEANRDKKNKKTVILSEEQKKYILNESQESKSISAAKKLLVDKLGYNEQEADEFVRIKLRNDLPVLRTPQGGKFILGATRMFIDGQLRSANDISNLNSTLKLVVSDAHINEYDRNLNGLSCSELIERFSQARTANLEAEKEEVNAMAFNEDSQYDIVRIDTFEQAQKYGDYTSWCVTHDERMFNSYTSDGINQFYFCLRHGFENVERVAGEDCPLDDYGLSMIAVCVNEDGALNTCTCRWNHDNGGNDSIMSAVEISRVVGVNFFNTFKPNGKWQEILNTALSRLQNGEAPEEVFDGLGNFHEGFAAVRLNSKINFLTRDGELLSQQWFGGASCFHEGFAMVKLNNKWNFINREGKYLSQQWFDWVYNFHEGFARVKLNGKYNFINREGKYLSQQWFDWVYNFHEDFAAVELNGKINFLTRDGKLLSQKWFDDVNNFNEGFAGVYLNDSWKYIDRNGKLWDKNPTIQEGMKKKRCVILSEAQRDFLLMESMSVNDIYSKYYSDIPEDVYNTVVTQADPTYNPQKPDKMGIYAKWLLGMVRKGMFKVGDVGEAKNLLTIFHKFKNNLEVKDVTQIHSMRELYDVVKPVMNSGAVASKGEERRKIKEEDASKWYEDSDWLVVIPYTEKAAKIYGKGTKWCTAADKDNMYDYYTQDYGGDLYILIRKSDGAKFQFHFQTDSFMDAEDNPIDYPIAKTLNLPEKMVKMFEDEFNDESCAGYTFPLIYEDNMGLNGYRFAVVLDGKYNILDYYEKKFLLDEWKPAEKNLMVKDVGYNTVDFYKIHNGLDGVRFYDATKKVFFPAENEPGLDMPLFNEDWDDDEWSYFSINNNGHVVPRTWFFMNRNLTERYPEEGYVDNASECSADGYVIIEKDKKFALFNLIPDGKIVLPSFDMSQWFDEIIYPKREDISSYRIIFRKPVLAKRDNEIFTMNEKGELREYQEGTSFSELTESADTKKKTVILSEEQKKYILKESEEKGSPLVNKKEGMPFYIDPAKVNVVKKYLDSGFAKGSFEDMDDNGYPTKVSVVAMLDGNGDVIRNLTDVQLFYLLQDRFKNIVANKIHRDAFLKQIIKDWFYGKIKPSGLLSVNMLNEAQEWNLILEAMSVGDIYQKYYSDIPEDVYRAVVTQADPTYNPQKPDKMGMYTKWLLGMVRKGTFKPGDVAEARNLLTIFGKFKNKLEVKDVTQLHSMKKLYDIVKPFMGQQTTGEKNREAKSGAEKVYEDGKWLVVVPHTEEAAKLYGKGTKWCTAADNNNMFEYYDRKGLLYIIINKSNPSEKYQFHFETKQYMDAEDEEIDINTFCKENPGIKDFVNKEREERERRFQEKLDSALNCLKNGENPKDIFDGVFDFSEGFAKVVLNNEWNFINREGELVSQKWFDEVGNFYKGLAGVVLNGKYNFLARDGELVSQQWFDYVGNFHEGFAAVMLNGKYNFLTRDGELLSRQWFDDAYNFREGFARVKLNDKFNFLTCDGKYLSQQWFDWVDGFYEGFAKVRTENGERKYISRNGNLWDKKPTV